MVIAKEKEHEKETETVEGEGVEGEKGTEKVKCCYFNYLVGEV